jgi:hypothetical protein
VVYKGGVGGRLLRKRRQDAKHCHASCHQYLRESYH